VNRIESMIAAAADLATAVDRLKFSAPVTHVYNPLRYAWDPHVQYLGMMNPAGARVLFLGMNPGPWGMAQTGVPFGQVQTVRDWLGIDAAVSKPASEHPKRPVEGLDCQRSEVSGERLWGLFRQRYRRSNDFFRDHFVANYCPLVFMEATGRNRTPDKLAPDQRKTLSQLCDTHLRRVVEILQPTWVVGVGAYAEQALRRNVADTVNVARILHPSPASPLANRGWGDQATRQLVEAGIWSR
jgi:single-strand selective monofunctional uracil DNA glycosylase